MRRSGPTDEEMVAAALTPLGEDRARELRERGWIRVDTEDHVLPYADGGFVTPFGKCELYSERLASVGMDPLPEFTPAAESPAGDPSLAARYPLALLTAKGAHHFLNSSYGNVERALKAEKTPLLDLHPDDAAARGICDGDAVRVFNDRGSVELPAGWRQGPTRRRVDAVRVVGLEDPIAVIGQRAHARWPVRPRCGR